MTEAIPGIHQIKLPMPTPDSSMAHSNVYLIQGENGALLIDSGLNSDEALDSLKKQLAKIRVDIKDISQIVITHAHRDHIGLAGKLKQLSQADFAIHHLEQYFFESSYTNVKKYLEQAARWLEINGAPADESLNNMSDPAEWTKSATQFSPDIILHGGEIISTGVFTFQVLWTPGHSAGHICLYEPSKKVLISGDNILPTIATYVGLDSDSGDDPLGNYLNSLATLKHLDVELILPGHEGPFTQLRPRINKIIEHLKRRNREILKLIEGEAKTAYQIAQGVNWFYKGGWKNLPPVHKYLALTKTLAHLESMRVAGKVDKLSRDSIIYYQST